MNLKAIMMREKAFAASRINIQKFTQVIIKPIVILNKTVDCIKSSNFLRNLYFLTFLSQEGGLRTSLLH